MSSNTLSRSGTFNTFDSAIRNLGTRQGSLADLQEKLTAGKRVIRPSDDPTAAAQAERARTRISRIETTQRMLENQRNTVALGESALGEANDVLQLIREKVVNAGGGAMQAVDRKSLAQDIQGLRDQLLSIANRKDNNGLALFGGLGNTNPLVSSVGSPATYTYNGLPGDPTSDEATLTQPLDGEKTWMFRTVRDGVFDANITALAPRLTGETKPLTSPVSVTNASLVTGDSYQLTVAGVPATYTVTNTTTAATVASGAYVTGQPINFEGLQMSITGTLKAGDQIDITPETDVFSMLDQTISRLTGASDTQDAAQAVGQALAQIDAALKNVSATRGQAGELLNKADRIAADQDSRAVQAEGDRSRAEDMDMIKGISDFQNQQTGYSAALNTYAQIQKLSLFNYIS